MQWNEEAIVLSSKKFGESNLIVTVFAETRGVFSGLVRGGQSKTKIAITNQEILLPLRGMQDWMSNLE